MKALWVSLWLALSASLFAAPDDSGLPPYAKFPAGGTDLLFSLFQTTYSFATDAEEPYPIILQVTRQGVPLWSQMAHIDRDWPFLSIECKVVWSPDFKHCAAAYRKDRESLIVVALDFTTLPVKQQTLPIDELADAAFEKSGDTKGRAPVTVRADTMEIGNDGQLKLVIAADRAQKHKVAAVFDTKSGELKGWDLTK